MSETHFDNGYWYVKELKIFAKQIGITSAAKLRKDEFHKPARIFSRIDAPHLTEGFDAA